MHRFGQGDKKENRGEAPWWRGWAFIALSNVHGIHRVSGETIVAVVFESTGGAAENRLRRGSDA